MSEVPSDKELAALSMYRLAELIKKDWTRPYFGAVPYIDALMALTDGGYYGEDSWQCMALYFLGNANSWRGPMARAVKAELHRRLKVDKP